MGAQGVIPAALGAAVNAIIQRDGDALILWTSVVLALQALLAYAVIAMPRGRWPVRNGGNESLLYFAAFLYLAVAGSGAFAPARWWRRRSSRTGSVRLTAR